PISPSTEWLPLAIGTAAVVAVSALAWRLRARRPIIGAAWAVYLILLAPVAGLTPSGLQMTADRYVYVPNLVLALVVGIAIARLAVLKRRPSIDPRSQNRAGPGLRPAPDVALVPLGAAAAVIIAAGCALTMRQVQYWRDSTTLWTRAIELDPRNDV